MYKDTAFCFLLEGLEIDMAKKLIDTAAKTGTGAANTASKRVVQKTPEATGNLIGNKIPDEITSVGKTKEKINKPEKRQQITNDLRFF